jgi:cell division protein FtsQ
VTLDGKLLINICEKVPIIRIYDANGKSIYVDKNGNFIPLSNRYTPRVIIASGYIGDMNINLSNNIHDSTYIDTPLNNVFQINNLIAKNELLKSQIGQVYVNSIGEYDLIPILGNHIIKLGKTVNVEEKMENLTSYYKKNLVTEDWDKYRTINLKYKDQIVCTKK